MFKDFKFNLSMILFGFGALFNVCRLFFKYYFKGGI